MINTTKVDKILCKFSRLQYPHSVRIGMYHIDIVNTFEYKGNPDNEVLYLGWASGDGTGEDYNHRFSARGLSEATVNDAGYLVMNDVEGTKVVIGFYFTRRVLIDTYEQMDWKTA